MGRQFIIPIGYHTICAQGPDEALSHIQLCLTFFSLFLHSVLLSHSFVKLSDEPAKPLLQFSNLKGQ